MPEKQGSTTRSSQLSMLLCDFLLYDGRIEKESDHAPAGEQFGWRNFPYKRQIAGITMAGRFISRNTFKIPKEYFRGFAVHQINAVTPDMSDKIVAREIMLVQRDRRVYVCSYNVCSE